MSPRNGHVSTTTGNLKASDYNDRPKTPSATNGETSPDSGIGRDLPLSSLDHWNHSAEVDSFSKGRRHRENSIYRRRSPTPPPMGIPRTPSPSRNDELYEDDLMDEPPPRIPTPGKGMDFKKMLQQSKMMVGNVTPEVDSYRPVNKASSVDIKPKMEVDCKSNETSAVGEKVVEDRNSTASSAATITPIVNHNPASGSSSSDQQCHPKKRWNNWGHTGPVRPSSPQAGGSVDGRSSVASDCSSTADTGHIPITATTTNQGIPANNPVLNPGSTLHSSSSAMSAAASKFRPKGKGFDWNTEMRSGSPYNSSPSPNSYAPQQQQQHSQGYPSSQTNNHLPLPPPNVKVTSTGIVPSIGQQHHQHPQHFHQQQQHANGPMGNMNIVPPQQQQQQPKSCVPLPIGRIPPPPPPPHSGKSILSAVDQVIMQTLNSGNRPATNNTTGNPSSSNFESSTYNNNLYKQQQTSSGNYNPTNHNHFNNGSNQKMVVPPPAAATGYQPPHPPGGHGQSNSNNYHQANSYSQQQQPGQNNMYGTHQHHTNNSAPPTAGFGRQQAQPHPSNSAYPVMQSPKIHPSAYAQQGAGGGSSSGGTGSYYNGGQHLGGNKAPYEHRNGYHRLGPYPQSSSYSSSASHPPPPGSTNKGIHDMYPQQPHYNSHYNHTSSSRQQQAQPHHHLNSSSASSSHHHQSHGLPQQGYNNNNHDHPHNQMLPTRR